MTEAGCDLLDRFIGVLAGHGEEKLVVGFCRTLVEWRFVEEVVEIEHDLGALVLPLGLECDHSFEVGVGIDDELGI